MKNGYVDLKTNELIGSDFNFIGFFLGIIQDTISQVQLFGIFALIKTNIGFIISTLSRFHPIWTKSILFISISLNVVSIAEFS